MMNQGVMIRSGLVKFCNSSTVPLCRYSLLSPPTSLSNVARFSLLHSQLNRNSFHMMFTNKWKTILSSVMKNQKSSVEIISPNIPTLRTSNCKISSLSSIDEIKDIVHEDVLEFDNEIKQLLQSSIFELNEMCCYYFDGRGKCVRPLTVFLMSRACNFHHNHKSVVFESQRKVALISEMIHISSLIHDDVVDISSMRRGKDSINHMYGDKNAVMTGNFVMSVASQLLASIDNCYVTSVISAIVLDLVRGEFMQESKQDRFDNYLKKTFKKTASLIANCCKAVAYLSGSDKEVVEAAHKFGTNMGISFQLIDDLLDYVASSHSLGKPAAADLQLGLATAPVLFACDKHPDLYEMISRRFSKPGDAEYALWAVAQSDALDETRMLAEQYSKWAVEGLSAIRPSPELEALLQLNENILERRR